MNVNEVSKDYTREDFLYKTKGKCPEEFGLKEFKFISDKCYEFEDCSTCRECAIKDIQFKDDYKWVFNLEEFKDQDIAIHCETEEEANKLFNILIWNGINKWENGDNLKCGNTKFKDLKNEEMLYNYNLEDKGLDWGLYSEWYDEYEYKVYKFSDVDFSNCWNKNSIDDVALNNESKNEINYKEENYKIQKQLDSMKDIYNVKQEQWENEQVEVIHILKERINNYQNSILKRQDEMENLQRDNKILKEMAESKEKEIKQLKNEKVELLLEITNYKIREQIIEIMKKASEML